MLAERNKKMRWQLRLKRTFSVESIPIDIFKVLRSTGDAFPDREACPGNVATFFRAYDNS